MSSTQFPVFIVCAGLLARILFLIFLMMQDPYRVLAGTDSLSFYIEAMQVAWSGRFLSWDIGWHIYVNASGLFMRLFGSSIFWMCLLSIIAWLLTALMVLKIANFCEASERMKVLSAAVIAFAPSLFLSTSVPLREPFQLLGITIILYSMFLFNHQKRATAMMLVLLGSIIAGSTHLAMLISVIVMFFSPLIYNSIIKYNTVTVGRIGFAVMIVILGYLVLLALLEDRNYGGSGNVFEAAESFQRTGATVDARAQYKSDIAFSSGFGTIYFIVIGFFQYLFEPMPWRISTFGDVIVFFENMLRLGLILFSLKFVLEDRGVHRMRVLFFLSLYLFIEFIWSTGTINWGTAARHHVAATALLLASSCAASAGYRFKRLLRFKKSPVGTRAAGVSRLIPANDKARSARR